MKIVNAQVLSQLVKRGTISPQTTIEIDFNEEADGLERLYVTTHNDVESYPVGFPVLVNCLRYPQAQTSKLDRASASVNIGSLSFRVIDHREVQGASEPYFEDVGSWVPATGITIANNTATLDASAASRLLQHPFTPVVGQWYCIELTVDSFETGAGYTGDGITVPTTVGAFRGVGANVNITTPGQHAFFAQCTHVAPFYLEANIGVTTVLSKVAWSNLTFTSALRVQRIRGNSIKGSRVRTWTGFENFQWAGYDQIIPPFYAEDWVTGPNFVEVRCLDATRQQRQEGFTWHRTQLNVSIEEDSTVIPITGTNPSLFPTIWHDDNFNLHPNQRVQYAKIDETGEVFAHSGTSVDPQLGLSFNVVERGVFGTGRGVGIGWPVVVDEGVDAANRPEISEFPYLEGDAVTSALALQTGWRYGMLNEHLPDHWSAGISLSQINIQSYETISNTIFNPIGNLIVRSGDPAAAPWANFGGGVTVSNGTPTTHPLTGATETPRILTAVGTGAFDGKFTVPSSPYLVTPDEGPVGVMALFKQGTSAAAMVGIRDPNSSAWIALMEVDYASKQITNTIVETGIDAVFDVTDVGNGYLMLTAAAVPQNKGAVVQAYISPTGQTHTAGQTSEFFGASYFLGFTPWEYVTTTTAIHAFDTSTSKDIFLQGPESEDLKDLIERQFFYWMRVYQTIGTDGRLGLARFTTRLNEASARLVLTTDGPASNISSISNITNPASDILNSVLVRYNWDPFQEKFLKNRFLVNPASIVAHKKPSKTKVIELITVHTGKHSDADIVNYFDEVISRAGYHPQQITVTCTPEAALLDPGDIVRVESVHLRDYSSIAGIGLSRNFEIIQAKIDLRTLAVTFALEGSSIPPTIEIRTADTAIAPAATYLRGTDISTLATITNGVLQGDLRVTGKDSLFGNDVIGTEYRYSGDLEIPFGVTFDWTNSITIYVDGFLTIDGKFGTAGLGGLAGQGSASISAAAGFLQTIYTNIGKVSPRPGIGQSLPPHGVRLNGAGGTAFVELFYNSDGRSILSGNVVEELERSNPRVNGSNVLVGLANRIGAGGYAGQAAFRILSAAVVETARGGHAGRGGPSATIVCKGLAVGPGGEINISGADGEIGEFFLEDGRRIYGSSGAGGMPGSLRIIVDGNHSVSPMGNGRLKAYIGDCPIPAGMIFMSEESDPVRLLRLNTYPAAAFLGTRASGWGFRPTTAPIVAGELPEYRIGNLYQVRHVVEYLVSAIPPAALPDTEAVRKLAAPAGLAFVASSDPETSSPNEAVLQKGRISWTPFTDSEALYAQVEMKRVDESAYQSVALARPNIEFVEVLVQQGQGYDFRIRFLSNKGSDGHSNYTSLLAQSLSVTVFQLPTPNAMTLTSGTDAHLILGANGSVIERVRIDLPQTGQSTAQGYEVQWRKNGDVGWTQLMLTSTVTETQFWMAGQNGQAYDFRYRVISKFTNKHSPWVESLNYTLAANTQAPPNPSTISPSIVNQDLFRVTILPVTALDLSHYEIRISVLGVGTTWEEATEIGTAPRTASKFERAVGNWMQLTDPPITTYIVWVKAFDIWGNESLNATQEFLNITVGSPQTVSTVLGKSTGTVRVIWGDGASTLPLAFYTVTKETSPGGPEEAVGTIDGISIVDTNPSAYAFYRVRPFDILGNTSAVPATHGLVLAAPNPVTDLVVTDPAENAVLSIGFQASSGTGAALQKFQVYAGPRGSLFANATLVAESATSPVKFSIADGDYTFWVVAVDVFNIPSTETSIDFSPRGLARMTWQQAGIIYHYDLPINATAGFSVMSGINDNASMCATVYSESGNILKIAVFTLGNSGFSLRNIIDTVDLNYLAVLDISVSATTPRVAVGEYLLGVVRVYTETSPGTWASATITNPASVPVAGSNGDRFGQYTAMNSAGNRIVSINRPQASSNETNLSLYMYKHNGSSWVLEDTTALYTAASVTPLIIRFSSDLNCVWFSRFAGSLIEVDVWVRNKESGAWTLRETIADARWVYPIFPTVSLNANGTRAVMCTTSQSAATTDSTTEVLETVDPNTTNFTRTEIDVNTDASGPPQAFENYGARLHCAPVGELVMFTKNTTDKMLRVMGKSGGSWIILRDFSITEVGTLRFSSYGDLDLTTDGTMFLLTEPTGKAPTQPNVSTKNGSLRLFKAVPHLV